MLIGHVLVAGRDLAANPVAQMRIGRLNFALDMVGLHIEDAGLAIGQSNLNPVLAEPREKMLADRVFETGESLPVGESCRIRIDQVSMRAWWARGRHGPRDIGPDVIFRTGICKGRQQFGMGANDMIGFHKGLLRHLPVARQPLDHVRCFVAPFERPGKMAVDIAQIILKRFTIRIGIDEYKPTPMADADFWQRIFLGRNCREIPLARHFL